MLRDQLLADIAALMIDVRANGIEWHELTSHEQDLMTMHYYMIDYNLKESA